MVTTMIIRTELSPVILMLPNRLANNRLSVTSTMDRANDRAILSRALSCLKKMRLQAKPGIKKTNIKPSIALMAGKPSRNGKTNLKSSLTGESQSTYFIPLYQLAVRMVYDLG